MVINLLGKNIMRFKMCLFALFCMFSSASAQIGLQLKGQNYYIVDGNLAIGDTTAAGLFDIKSSINHAVAYHQTFHAGTAYPIWRFRKSNTNTIGSRVKTNSGQILGSLQFYGVDNETNWESAALILVEQDGGAGTGLPGRMRFQTFSSGGTQHADAFVIHPDGTTTIGTDQNSGTEALVVGGNLRLGSLRDTVLKFPDPATTNGVFIEFWYTTGRRAGIDTLGNYVDLQN